MKFRTEIDIARWQIPLEYDHHIVCLGSCFATNIAQRLQRQRFKVVESPTGILFNPASIARSIEAMRRSVSGDSVVERDRMVQLDGRWLNYDFHSSVDGDTLESAYKAMSEALVKGGKALRSCDLLVVTLGTAWCYEHNESGMVVANCHKQPKRLFTRRLMTVAEVEEALDRIVDSVACRVLFTVSPVRHVGEGLEDNSLSKALLRVAVAEVCARRGERVGYFPSYEIMMDDLRDYRFYASDMAHPTEQAVDYIADKFFEAALSDSAQSTMREVSRVVAAAEHRPFNPACEEYKIFCRKQLDAIDRLQCVDLSEERAYFERMLAENV
jgi:hypothetical protein